MTVDPPTDNPQRLNTRAGSGRAVIPGWWRWYHFYFLLALFDLVVILASLFLYHRTIASYQTALTELDLIEAKLRWLANVQSAVVDLNAPGNDVFESRDAARETRRFSRRLAHVHHLVGRQNELGVDLSEFRVHLALMVSQEEEILRIFESVGNSDGSAGQARQVLNRASSIMAAMDRFQADALTALSLTYAVLLDEQELLLREYGEDLAAHASAGKYLLGTVAVILVGVFWYGRKLQRTHDQMLKQRQRALAERQDRLAAVGEVCSSVAHGIRNPLASITSSAQLAAQFGTLDDSTRLRIDDILRESVRLNNRVTKLLDFSREPSQAFAPYDLTETIRRTIDEMRPQLRAQRIEINCTLDSRPLVVHGDAERLAQSIIEVLSNCIDHMPGGGRVDVGCWVNSSAPEQAVVEIQDEGPGIPQETREHVFELFFSTKQGGHGIGLASVRKSIELQGGSVELAESRSGGVLLRLVLPLACVR